MTILIIGGTGKLGFAIAKTLQCTTDQSVLLTSRRGSINIEPSSLSSSSPYHHHKSFRIVQFDWYNPSTFTQPFNYVSHYTNDDTSLTPIDRVLLVVPISMNMLEHVGPFVEIAISKGVKRFVLVSTSAARRGDPGLGKVHEYISGRGVEWCVLRPSWFMENFATNYLIPIRDYDVIPSVAGDGRVPFISIDDIVKPACAALIDEKSHNREHKIVGPELLTYDQAADIFSRILGRRIKHKRESLDGHAKLYRKVGLGREDAALLTKYECGVARGADEIIFSSEDKIVGKRRFEDFVKTHKRLWVNLKF